MLSPLSARLLALAAFNGLIATLMAALGSHGVADTLNDLGTRGWYDTAVLMQFGTGVGLLGCAVLCEHGKKAAANWAALVMASGLTLFSGSLYILSLDGPGSLGSFHWLTPVGGILMLSAWGMLAVSALRSGRGFRG